MLLYLLALSAAPHAVDPGYDHINEVAVVAAFLAEAEKSEVNLAQVEIVNRISSSENSAPHLFAYIRECSIDEISVISTSERRLPVGVKWNCGRFIRSDGKLKLEERTASFWEEEGKIVKIAFGEGPPLVIRPLTRGEEK